MVGPVAIRGVGLPLPNGRAGSHQGVGLPLPNGRAGSHQGVGLPLPNGRAGSHEKIWLIACWTSGASPPASLCGVFAHVPKGFHELRPRVAAGLLAGNL